MITRPRPQPGKAGDHDHGHELHAQPPAHDLVGVALVELAALGEGADPEEQDRQHDQAGDDGEDDSGSENMALSL
jgi:hypothetical protein